MLKHLNDLLCSQFKRRKCVLDYGKTKWDCGIKSLNYEYFSVLKKTVEYSLVKVIPKDLGSIFFEKKFKRF